MNDRCSRCNVSVTMMIELFRSDCVLQKLAQVRFDLGTRQVRVAIGVQKTLLQSLTKQDKRDKKIFRGGEKHSVCNVLER
jgi:hypothetical protein